MKPLYGRRRAVLLMSLAVVLVACVFVPASVALPPGTFAAPGLRVTPPTLHFGAVAPGETRDRTVSITNVGPEPAEFSAIGGTSTLFTWNYQTFLDTCPLTGPAAGVFLLPGDTCSLTIIAQSGASTAPGDYEGAFLLGKNTGQVLVRIPLAMKVP